jgi:hypothetical protein
VLFLLFLSEYSYPSLTNGLVSSAQKSSSVLNFFGINYTAPPGWRLEGVKQLDNHSAIAKFAISSSFSELGSLDFSAIVLNVTNYKLGPAIEYNHFNFLLRDEKDCKTSNYSTRLVNGINYTSQTAICASFKYKVYRTVVDSLGITLTYSGLASAYLTRLQGFEDSLENLVVK